MNPVASQTLTNVGSISPEIASEKEFTPRYNLPIYNSADAPEWIKAWNSLMNNIDSFVNYLEENNIDHTINKENEYITINFSVTHTNDNSRSKPSLNINIIV